MPALPARNIVKVDRKGRAAILADGTPVAFDDLSGGETLKALALLFPSSGIKWNAVPMSARLSALCFNLRPWSTIEARFPSTCGTCGASIPVGTPLRYSGKGAPVTCSRCSPPADWIYLTPADQVEQEAPQVEQEATQDSPKLSPTAPQAKGADALASALLSAIEQVASSAVNEEQVRSIVGDAVAAAVEEATRDLRPHVTEVRIGERPVVKVEGRQHACFSDLLAMVQAGTTPYLVGPPGTGKTTLAEQVAKALNVPFYSLSCGPTTPTSRLWGFTDANGAYRETDLRKAYEGGGVFLLDETDNGHPGTLAEFNQAMANGHASFPDRMVGRHGDCILMGAANTFGTGPNAMFVGRNALDLATLDRFTMLEVGIDEALETDLATARAPQHAEAWLRIVRKVRANVAEHALRIVVSPRASIDGAALLAAGFTTDRVVNMRLLRGVDADQRRKALAGTGLS